MLDPFRGCCEWSTFRDGFLSAARHYNVPLVLVNRLEARRDWRKGLTGYEALYMQRKRLLAESYYQRGELLGGGK